MFLRTTVEAELLRVVTTGTFSSQAARKNFLEILDAVAQHQSEKVLFDGRKIMGEPDMMNRFYYGEFVAEALRKFRMSHNDPQFAYVLEPPVLHPSRIGETVAVNRGMNVKVFDNIADALQWLDVETPSR